MNYYFIVNPKSRSGRGIRIWQELEPVIKARLAHYEVFFTAHYYHATQLAAQITESLTELSIIVVLGGDGTLNEVINGLTNLPLVKLGYIPTGSGNDFARSIGLPSSSKECLELILSPGPCLQMDIGLIQAPNHPCRRFVVSSGIGFDASVTEEALDSPIKDTLNKLKLGKLTYVLIALKQIIKLKPTDAILTLDNQPPIKVPKMIFTSFHIQRYEGGGFAFTPSASSTDGQLDLCVINNMSRLKILFLLPTAFSGRHIYFKGVTIHRCHTASIQTRTQLPTHTDGEAYKHHCQLKVTCQQQKLSIITQTS